MGEIKQANFRIDTEAADAFRQFCEEQGFNQAQGFDHLIQVLELNRAKAGIEGRLTEITTFEEYVKKIMDAYLNSLQIAQNTEERVREDFKNDIVLRDRALADNERKIMEKDEKIAQLTADTQVAEKTAKEAMQTAANAEKQAVSATQIAEEKGKINDMLSAKLAEADAKLNGYNELKLSEESLKKEISEMKHKNEMLQAELNHTKAQADDLMKQLQAADESLATAKESIADMKVQITSLNRDLEEEKRENERAKELAVERAIVQTEKELQKQMETLRDEKTRLQVQLEMLQGTKTK